MLCWLHIDSLQQQNGPCCFARTQLLCFAMNFLVNFHVHVKPYDNNFDFFIANFSERKLLNQVITMRQHQNVRLRD